MEHTLGFKEIGFDGLRVIYEITMFDDITKEVYIINGYRKS